MCLAIPSKVLEILPDRKAKLDMGGIEQVVALDIVDYVKPGDYLMVHAGFAIAIIDKIQAEETLELAKELQELSKS
ncbi:MAG: HypC/HybG/HupF family hydrogenase formation chaperone [Eggerthellaceae bacterium]|nr:HypC/HybG/HupF family hydrogenase formation chaperone [Eggerthellaceae bacterium]